MNPALRVGSNMIPYKQNQAPAAKCKKELIMAKLNKTRTIAAALLGTIVLAAPVTSFAQDFRSTSNGFANCQVENRNNQVAGGVFGAVIGGVLGSQLSGRNARTGSTIAGASLGAITGSALGGTARNCNVEQSRIISNRGVTGNTVFATPPVTNRGFSNQGFSNRGFSNGISSRNGTFRQASLGHTNLRIEKRLKQIDRELYAADLKLEKLYYEKERLIKRSKFSHGRTGFVRKELQSIKYEIKLVEDCKADLKREAFKLERALY